MAARDHGVDQLVDNLFRHQAGRLVAILTRIFGPGNLALAEDVAQDALIKALEIWPYKGVPANPTAWLTEVAKNRALNELARARNRERLSHQAVAVSGGLDGLVDERLAQASQPWTESMDEVARLMFVACHPALPLASRVALTLKVVCGLSVDQIASALLARPTAIAQRLVRAKRQVIELRLDFEVPVAERPARLDAVLAVLYLLFNEGYSAEAGKNAIRGELCAEAIRVCSLVAGLPECDLPAVHALLALMLFAAARLPGRVTAGGDLLTLARQDRTLWDQERIARGFTHLARSARGGALTTYHLEAGIAAHHAAARSYEETDWESILGLYDRLVAVTPSPVAALNRAVAESRCRGPASGLRSLEEVGKKVAMQRYYLYWATLATLHEEQGEPSTAIAHYGRALRCRCSPSERRYLESRLAAVTAASRRPPAGLSRAG